MHPYYIRTLIRVVNMLGQEVNPKLNLEEMYYFNYTNDATV